MSKGNPHPVTKFQPGHAKIPGSGMKKGQQVFKYAYLRELEKIVKGSAGKPDKSKLDIMVENAVAMAVNGDIDFLREIREVVDGNKTSIEVTTSEEANIAGQISNLNEKQQTKFWRNFDRAYATASGETGGRNKKNKVAVKKHSV